VPAMDYSKVAELYDLYVQTEVDVLFFLREAEGCRSVLELTSGTGRLSLPLLRRGVPLTCLDSSPEMLAVLRRKLDAQGLSAPIYEMDVTGFSLPEMYDLIIFPFNAFSEITGLAAQRSALAAIHAHLSEQGRFICTLHNPPVRLKNADGQIRLRGEFPLPGNGGKLRLYSLEHYEPDKRLVKGAQFYEIFAADGVMVNKWSLDLQFYLHTRDSFEEMARAQGFQVEALYGDYERAAFTADRSPFMIWVLTNCGAEV
jgi:SAM-dependent methyltransferase